MGFGDDFCWVEMHFVPPLRRCCFLVCLYLGCATYFLRSCWETSRVGREKHPKFQTWPETQQNYMAKDSGSPTKVGLLSLWSLPPKIHLSQFWMVFTACIYIIYIRSLHKLVSGKLVFLWYRLYPSCITWWYHQNEMMDFMISSWYDQKLLLEGVLPCGLTPRFIRGACPKGGIPNFPYDFEGFPDLCLFSWWFFVDSTMGLITIFHHYLENIFGVLFQPPNKQI